MISSWRRRWRRRRAAHHAGKKQDTNNDGMELIIPSYFICPISLDLMKDPVTMSSGITYDRESIKTWIQAGNHTCPITNQILRTLEPIPNHTIRKMIKDWCLQNKSYGIERVPTPRIPLSSSRASEILSKVVVASVARQRKGGGETYEEAKSQPLSSASLDCPEGVFKSLKEIEAEALVENEGEMEALFKSIKEPTCPKTTKASLLTIYDMVSSPENEVRARFIQMGLVSLLLELLLNSERSICEKALGILDGLCSCNEGREKACAHALTIPVLVKKLLRVSYLATEFSMSILWKLSKNEKREEEGGLLFEAVQLGAFQKLVLVLQVECDEKTKDKANELLKLLNPHRLKCVDSVDFKNLERHKNQNSLWKLVLTPQEKSDIFTIQIKNT